MTNVSKPRAPTKCMCFVSHLATKIFVLFISRRCILLSFRGFRFIFFLHFLHSKWHMFLLRSSKSEAKCHTHKTLHSLIYHLYDYTRMNEPQSCRFQCICDGWNAMSDLLVFANHLCHCIYIRLVRDPKRCESKSQTFFFVKTRKEASNEFSIHVPSPAYTQSSRVVGCDVAE